MARRKTITRENILSAVYDVISTEGFEGFTARNIAQAMNTSTQPIYLEFKNMDELRDVFFKRITTHIRADIYDNVVTGDPVVDTVLNYVTFAKNEPKLFRAIFIEEHDSREQLSNFSRDIFLEKMSGNEVYDVLNTEQKESLYLTIWIIATGLAALVSAGRAYPTQEQIIGIVENTVKISALESGISFKWKEE